MLDSLKNLINYCLRFDPKTTHYTKKLEGCCLEIILKSPKGINLIDRHYRITFGMEGLETFEQVSPVTGNAPSVIASAATPGTKLEEQRCNQSRNSGPRNDDEERTRDDVTNTCIASPPPSFPRKRESSITATPLTFASLLLHKNSSDLRQDLIMDGDTEILACLEQWFHASQIDWAEIIAGFLGDSAAYGFDSTIHRLRTVGQQKLNDLSASMGEYAVEEGFFAPSALVNPFLEAVDRLRARIDRLEAKL